MDVCKWCTNGSDIENSFFLSVLPRLNKTFNQSIIQSRPIDSQYIADHITIYAG